MCFCPFQRWFLLSFFFFFSSRRRHTRLQGDWSSDVCSSDLQMDVTAETVLLAQLARDADNLLHRVVGTADDARRQEQSLDVVAAIEVDGELHRSEERRVGKECRSRGWRYHYKKK